MKTKDNKNTFSYAFKQQILRAWQPVPTLCSTVTIFIVLGLIFIGFGVALVVLSSQIVEAKVRYDDYEPCVASLGASDPQCVITITVEKVMKPPIFVYYELENFYQNHRRYLKSRDDDQLRGELKDVDQLTSCDPVVTNSDVRTPLYSFGDKERTDPLPPGNAANPCGLVARSFFNDTYTLLDGTTGITINQTGIAWEADIKNKFKAPPNAGAIQWTDVTDEHFIVWMRTAATPDFRKLWGRIERILEPGTYTLEIQNNYPVSSFDGTKSVVLSTANAFGGKNYFLGIAYLVVGGIALIVAILFFVKDKVSPARNLPKFE